MTKYTIQRAEGRPDMTAGFDDPSWAKAETLFVDQVRHESSDHRPVTRVKVLYDAENLYVLFDVADRYVVCHQTEFQSSVCRDSCVEFFVKPRDDKGYFNFELNCGGTMLVYYIEDPEKGPDGDMRKRTSLTPDDARQVEIHTTMPRTIEEEIAEPTPWRLSLRIPLPLLEKFAGPIGDPAGQTWRANFYKCGSDMSHPHWITWAPIVGRKSFHQPDQFGVLELAP